MGLAGTDVAVETADIALAADDLRMLLAVGDLGEHTLQVIKQNYGMSIAVNAIGLIVGAGGALSPVVAAILHNASSVAVVANSSRLIRYQVDQSGAEKSDTHCCVDGGAPIGRAPITGSAGGARVTGR